MDALIDLLFTKAGAVFAAIVIVLLCFWGWHMEYGTEKNVTFTVTGLDDQTSYSGGHVSHKYLVFTTRADGNGGTKTEVFEDTDSLPHGKTDSSDVWARFINAGKGAEWDCPVFGYRLFLTSSYRDILDGCKLLKQGTAQAVTVG